MKPIEIALVVLTVAFVAVCFAFYKYYVEQNKVYDHIVFFDKNKRKHLQIRLKDKNDSVQTMFPANAERMYIPTNYFIENDIIVKRKY